MGVYLYQSGNPRRTPVTGLQLNIHIEQRTGTMTRFYPYIVIAAKGQDGQQYRTSRFITPTTRTYPEAWQESCKLLAKIHDLQRTPSRWLHSMPPVQQFERLLHWYSKNGKPIPVDTLDYLRESTPEGHS